jgi:uncharacterized protein
MHINVRDILTESVGYNRAYKVSGERPKLEGIELAEVIEGEITISRLDESLLVRGQLRSEIRLECHRCLSTFTRPITINLKQEFAANPAEEQLPTEGDEIDLAPLVEQEIILSLPIKLLCRPDCPGIVEADGMYAKPLDQPVRLQDRARITKGTSRGRT